MHHLVDGVRYVVSDASPGPIMRGRCAEGEKKRWDEEKAILIERLAMYGDFENI